MTLSNHLWTTASELRQETSDEQSAIFDSSLSESGKGMHAELQIAWKKVTLCTRASPRLVASARERALEQCVLISTRFWTLDRVDNKGVKKCAFMIWTEGCCVVDQLKAFCAQPHRV